MLRTHLKLALRTLRRHRAFALLNIAGLAIGMAASMLILLWVRDELSFDRWETHAKDIYRITSASSGQKFAVTPPAMTVALQATEPEVRNTVRVSAQSGAVFSTKDKTFKERDLLYVDSTFFEVFSYRLKEGDPAKALRNPDGIVLTQAMARKYFGDEDPIGKVLKKDNRGEKIVTGVLADVPANAHLRFDALMSTGDPDIRSQISQGYWTNFIFYDYILTNDGFNDPKRLERRMDELFGENNKDIKVTFQLQPLTRIHLYSDAEYDMAANGNVLYVRIFFIVAIIILIVACINFMNLATARSARRAKEVGLRKVVGARRGQLIVQFLGESVLISLIAYITAMAIVWLALPYFNDLAGKNLNLTTTDGKFIGVAILTGLISGAYPALFLSGFQPGKVLKGQWRSLGSNKGFRNALVVVQFVISIVLLIGTALIYAQLRYIKNKDLGYDKTNLLYMELHGKMAGALKDYAVVSDLPTYLVSGSVDMDWPGKEPGTQIEFARLFVNENFIKVFHMTLLSGRTFTGTDSGNYIINETAAKKMGMTAATAVGQHVTFQTVKGTIVGVVKDFNFKPLQRAVEPMVMPYNPGFGYAVIRTTQNAAAATIKRMQKVAEGYPFTYGFIDDDLAKLYQGDRQMSGIFDLFALLGVFISCLGLYGLSAFIAEQRTREIGVRKVLGASVAQIVGLLSGDFTRLILLASLIAIPLAAWAVNQWLQTFAYHIQPGWGIFALAPVAALLIAWLTVSYESIKAAVANPVKTLRSE